MIEIPTSISSMRNAFWQKNLKRRIAKINLHPCLYPPPSMILQKKDIK
jgi:hypothetical protein